MQGSVVVVTGGSSGNGFVSAQTLVALGAQVILIGRDPIKFTDESAAIQSRPDNVKSLFEVADLSLLTETRALAGRLLDSQGGIDVLLNNASGFFRQRRETAEGLEYTFALTTWPVLC